MQKNLCIARNENLCSRILKGSICCFLLILFNTVQASDTIRYNSNFESVLCSRYILIGSENATALIQLPDFDIGLSTLSYSKESGNFKPSLEGTSLLNYQVNIRQYKQLSRASIFGEFAYSNSYEKNVNYITVDNPYQRAPYYFSDTLASGNYRRESFLMKGKWAFPVSAKTDIGLAASYQMKLAHQTYDPRALNTISNFSIAPGLNYHFKDWSLGMNISYRYYNEDISIKTIKSNTSTTFYSLNGLGSYNDFFEAQSAMRLYKRHTVASGMQIQHDNNLLEIKGFHYKETIEDGRVNSINGGWQSIKTPSLVNGKSLLISEKYTRKGLNTNHQWKISWSLKQDTGTEIFQRLETTHQNDYQTSHWVTYMQLDKYKRSQQEVDLSKEWFQMLSDLKRKYSFHIKTRYIYNWEQLLESQTALQSYSNLTLSTGGEYLFLLKKGELIFQLETTYQYNIRQKSRNIPENFFSEHITNPDFNYNTSNRLRGDLSLIYEGSLFQQHSLHYFIKGVYKVESSINKLNRNNRCFGQISLGFIW